MKDKWNAQDTSFDLSWASLVCFFFHSSFVLNSHLFRYYRSYFTMTHNVKLHGTRTTTNQPINQHRRHTRRAMPDERHSGLVGWWCDGWLRCDDAWRTNRMLKTFICFFSKRNKWITVVSSTVIKKCKKSGSGPVVTVVTRKTPETRTPTRENPYPWTWVGVFAGRGTGCPGIPQGYPW
jgi:hypothetical protein